MSFAAQMRVGSLEITLAIAVFAVFAGRVRAPRHVPGAFELAAAPQSATFEVAELESLRTVERNLPLVVGRSSQSGLSLLDGEVSRRHARLDAEGGVVYITDLGSRNGTYLNGERVTESIEVRPGDSIQLGNARLRVIRL